MRAIGAVHAIWLALGIVQPASALDLPMDQVVLELPGWSALPDRTGDGGLEKRGISPDGKTLVNAWSSANPKATVEQGLIFLLLPLVKSPEELRERAAAMKIAAAEVDFIIGLAKSADIPIGATDGKIESVGVYEFGTRKVYYVLVRPDDGGDAALYLMTQGGTPQSANTAVFYGSPEALKNAETLAKQFREATS